MGTRGVRVPHRVDVAGSQAHSDGMAGLRPGMLAALLAMGAMGAMSATCAGCGARSELFGATGGGGDAGSDTPAIDGGADAQPGGCAVVREARCSSWSLGAASTISFALAAKPHLRELVGDCTGAWLLADATAVGTAQPVTVIARLDLQGRVIDAQVLVAVPSMPATLAVDFGSQRAAVFGAGSAGYVFLRLDAPEFPNGAFVPVTPTAGFSLAGASHGTATPTGFSFLAEEVRALWGLERLGVTNDGAFRDRLVLGVPEEIGLSASPRYERVAYDDGAYTVLWLDRRAGTREALAYDAAELPGATQRLRVANDASFVLGATATRATSGARNDDGFVDAHREGLESESALLDFYDRSGATLRRQVRRPSGFASTLQGFSMAFTRGTLLSVNEGGSGVLRLELVAYDYDGDAFAPVVGRPLAVPISTSRTTAAGPGAIVAWDDDAGTMQAAAVTCP